MSTHYPQHMAVIDWLAGIPMQYFEEGVFKDLPHPSATKKMPHFYVDGIYRRAPIALRYRLARVGKNVIAVNNLREAGMVESTAGFGEYLTEWIEP